MNRKIVNERSMRKHLLFSVVLLGALTLSGCTTEEVRQKKDASGELDFYPMKEKEPAAQTPAAQKQAVPPKNNSLTNKKMYKSAPVLSIDQKKEYTATLKTDQGDIEVSLTAKDTPITVNNFVFLAREKFYDNTIFHRVIDGFMIQGGDPQGTGMGDPGYRFDDEAFEGEYSRGTIAMANSGPDTNGSQFFIMHKDYPLPPNYVIFGKVTSGIEVVDKIATAPVIRGGEGSSPVTPVVVKTIEIKEK